MNENPILRIIAVIALVVILILGAWGIIILAFNAPSFLSNLGGIISAPFSHSTNTQTPANTQSQSGEQVIIGAPTTILSSGTPFTISWTHTGGTSEYSFTLLYSCNAVQNVTLAAPLPTGSYKTVSCNTPFNYTNAQSQMTLIPHVTGAEGASTQITVSAINLATGTTTSYGSAILQFNPSGVSASSSKGNTSSIKGYPTTNISKGYASTSYVQPSNPNGIADLALQILSVTQGSAQFKIVNEGTKIAPAGWIFIAQLPAAQPYTFTSRPQIALLPGAFIINTLSWNSSAPIQNCPTYQTYPYMYPQYSNCISNSYYNYNQTLTITADPYGTVYDANRSNNSATVSI